MSINQKGFTIVELLIVIVVIGILAAITIVAFNGVQTRGKFAKVSQDLKSMQKLIELYKADNGEYPITPSPPGWLRSHANPDDFIPGIVPKYAPSLPRYTWSTPASAHAYLYRSDGTEYKLIRLGQPLQPGEAALVPDSMKDGTWTSTYQDRYGYWSPGGAGF